jgi:hypothetical protein
MVWAVVYYLLIALVEQMFGPHIKLANARAWWINDGNEYNCEIYFDRIGVEVSLAEMIRDDYKKAKKF